MELFDADQLDVEDQGLAGQDVLGIQNGLFPFDFPLGHILLVQRLYQRHALKAFRAFVRDEEGHVADCILIWLVLQILNCDPTHGGQIWAYKSVLRKDYRGINFQYSQTDFGNFKEK